MNVESEIDRRVAEKMREANEKPPVSDIDEEEQPPLRPPQQSSRLNLGGGGMGKTALVSLVVGLLVIYGMASALGGGPFVTKTDFTKNIQGFITASEQTKADLSKTQTAVAQAVQGIPNTVTSAITQQANQWTSASTAAKNTADAAKTAADTAKITADSAQSKITTLQAEIATMKTTMANMQATIDELKESGVGQVPTISSFSPTSGNTGTSVVVTGTKFVNVTGVTFGGVPAQSFTVNSVTQITVVVGSGATGAIGVTASGGTATSSGTFTFTGATIPIVTSFSPTSGNVGSTIVVSGGNFIGITGVTVGGMAVQSFTVNSTAQITAVLGNGSTGVVAVTNANGTGTSTSTFTFTGGGQQGTVTASIVGGSTMSLVSTGTTINISVQNNGSKAVYAEQLGVTLQFLNPPTAINTWGLLLNGAANNPSYSIVPGIVSYVWAAAAYIPPGTSQTVSITLTAPNLTVYPQNFTATVSVTGYSSL